jgi:hypothetical protein
MFAEMALRNTVFFVAGWCEPFGYAQDDGNEKSCPGATGKCVGCGGNFILLWALILNPR